MDSAVLQGFLADLRRNAQPVAAAPDGMFGIPETAQLAVVPSTTIVCLLLDGALVNVCVLMDVPEYRAVLVDPEEVRCVAEPTSEDVLMPAHLIPKQIGSSLAVMRALMAPREGGAYIPAVEGSTQRRTFALAKDVHAFVKEHIGLQSFSEETGISITELRRRLAIAGVKQIGDPSVLKTWFYRREDLTFI